MEERKELEQMLESIQKILDLYNSINQEEKLKLVNQAEQKNVSNVFVCVYNNNCVGLFKKMDWSTPIHQWTKYHSPEYNAGSIYIGIDSNYIGMKETHEGFFKIMNGNKLELKSLLMVKVMLLTVICKMV